MTSTVRRKNEACGAGSPENSVDLFLHAIYLTESNGRQKMTTRLISYHKDPKQYKCAATHTSIVPRAHRPRLCVAAALQVSPPLARVLFDLCASCLSCACR